MRGERGSVTAEFAVAVPAAVVVLAACLGGLRLGAERLRVVDAAAQAARAAAVGTTSPRLATASTTVVRRGDLVCATVVERVPLLGLPVPVASRSCALAGLAP